MTRPDRNDAAAFASIRDRAQTEARRKLSWRFEYHRHSLRRYGWTLRESVPNRAALAILASGRTFTRAGRERAWYREYLRELNPARPAVETSPAANRFRPWVR